jgi:hypothetical protein
MDPITRRLIETVNKILENTDATKPPVHPQVRPLHAAAQDVQDKKSGVPFGDTWRQNRSEKMLDNWKQGDSYATQSTGLGLGPGPVPGTDLPTPKIGNDLTDSGKQQAAKAGYTPERLAQLAKEKQERDANR